MYQGLGCAGKSDCGCGCEKPAGGLGFAETFSDSGESTWLDRLQGLDWHEWALLLVGGYVVYGFVKRETQAAGRAIGRPFKAASEARARGRKRRARLAKLDAERESILAS